MRREPDIRENSPRQVWRRHGPSMIQILEEIIRNRHPTARCTAIRTLLEFATATVVDPNLYPDDLWIRRKGHIVNNS